MFASRGGDKLLRILFLAVLLAMPSALSAKTCLPLDVRVMSYNIRLDVDSDGPNAWPFRRSELIGQIELVRPDIFGLQEVVPGQRRDVAAALPGYELLGVARDDGRDAGEYSPLGIRTSRFKVVTTGTFWLSETPDRPTRGWDAAFPRIVTWARLQNRQNRARLLVLNTHWDHQGALAREKSAALILDWLSHNRSRDEHLLLVGDFNASLSEPSMLKLLAGGLRDGRSIAAERALGPSTTFNGFQLMAPASAAIDHILLGASWKVKRHWTVAQHVDGRMLSDHYPVVADLEANVAQCP